MPVRDEAMIRAKGEAIKAAGSMKLHRKMCRTCTQFTDSRRRWCDEGWAIEQAIRKAKAEVDDLAAADLSQPGLW